MGRRPKPTNTFEKELEELGLEEAKKKIRILKSELLAYAEISNLLRGRVDMLVEIITLYEEKYGCMMNAPIKSILKAKVPSNKDIEEEANDKRTEG